jgi:redox-sensitive bicupin YhaK (pirin superfamily)
MTMLTILKAVERGHADHGWLNTWHTFSFADYYGQKLVHGDGLAVSREERLTVSGDRPAEVLLFDLA